MSQTKMLNRKKHFTSSILCQFLRQNLIIGMYFYLSATISQTKIAIIKSVFKNVSRLNQSSQMNNTVTNKIKRFPHLFVLGTKMAFKRKRNYQSIITTRLDIYVYKYKVECIWKSHNKYLIEFVDRNPYFHQILILQLRLVYSVAIPPPISENFPDTKITADFHLSRYIELNSTSFFEQQNDISW